MCDRFFQYLYVFLILITFNYSDINVAALCGVKSVSDFSDTKQLNCLAAHVAASFFPLEEHYHCEPADYKVNTAGLYTFVAEYGNGKTKFKVPIVVGSSGIDFSNNSKFASDPNFMANEELAEFKSYYPSGNLAAMGYLDEWELEKKLFFYEDLPLAPGISQSDLVVHEIQFGDYRTPTFGDNKTGYLEKFWSFDKTADNPIRYPLRRNVYQPQFAKDGDLDKARDGFAFYGKVISYDKGDNPKAPYEEDLVNVQYHENSNQIKRATYNRIFHAKISYRRPRGTYQEYINWKSTDFIDCDANGRLVKKGIITGIHDIGAYYNTSRAYPTCKAAYIKYIKPLAGAGKLKNGVSFYIYRDNSDTYFGSTITKTYADPRICDPRGYYFEEGDTVSGVIYAVHPDPNMVHSRLSPGIHQLKCDMQINF